MACIGRQRVVGIRVRPGPRHLRGAPGVHLPSSEEQRSRFARCAASWRCDPAVIIPTFLVHYTPVSAPPLHVSGAAAGLGQVGRTERGGFAGRRRRPAGPSAPAGIQRHRASAPTRGVMARAGNVILSIPDRAGLNSRFLTITTEPVAPLDRTPRLLDSRPASAR